LSEPFYEMRPLAKPPDAAVRVPGSKSISNRALLIAALASGESVLRGALYSDDTRYMSAALTKLGVEVVEDEPAASFRVCGANGTWPRSQADLYVGNAGTAMRFLVAALCLGRGRYRIDGNERMRERPIGDLVDALTQLGVDVRCELREGCPPVVVEARGLRGGKATVSGDKSSQFLSALLQVGAYAEQGLSLVVSGNLIARPYVDMTIRVMTAFGVNVERNGYSEFVVPARQRYRARAYEVEPDASSAHYFLAAAALTAGRVRIEGLGRDSLQGDAQFANLLAEMGARVRWEERAVEVSGPERLRGIDADLNAISDTAPTLAVLGAFAASPVRIRNVAHVRWQESDRVRAVATELTRLGAQIEELEDGLIVHPSALHGGTVRTYDDHRIAMSFALAGLVVPGIRIAAPECVRKTFPGYFECLESLRR
jgi:3-phosphoshikimate 1-carboxyvinyltransferase